MINLSRRLMRGEPPNFLALVIFLLFIFQLETLSDEILLTDETFMSSPARTNALTIRVGLLEEYQKVTFQMHGLYRIESLKGELLREPAASEMKWRARIEDSLSAQFMYSVLAASFNERAGADSLADKLGDAGMQVTVRQIGGAVEVDDNVLGDNTLYRVQVGTFKTEKQAKEFADSMETEFSPRIVREIFRGTKGRVEFFDSEVNETYMTDDGFRLIPQNKECKLTLGGVLVGTGFKYERTENRDYPGIIEIYLDSSGQLAALNEVSIDQYLKGVVPSEMPASFPEEALKAQAIAARTVVMAKKAVKHLNDPYELCAHVHCQVYTGVTRLDERTSRAVDETKGQVLMAKGELIDAFYCAVCGGHTEDASATWMTPERNPCKGVVCDCDEEIEVPDLTTETGVRKWILSSPAVCCNLNGTNSVPVSSDYGRKKFRWEISYNRAELEEIIKTKTGEDIGTLYDILPIKRGVSGRLHEIEILGSRKNLKLKRELKIRRALAKSELESSCFLVELVHDSSGMPKEIIFTGAGWGHGVGMCQCGAARMAANGKSYMDILSHYYPFAAVQKRY